MPKTNTFYSTYVPISVPGIVIDHFPASSNQYIGSPSIAKLPNGEYIVSHDAFGPGSTSDTSFVFASNDKGMTWQERSIIRGQWWSTLFVHHGALYIMGTSKEYGNCIIRKSVDGGRNWSKPENEDSGLLLADGMYHCAPVPVIRHDGRLWRAMEEYSGPKWGAFHAFVMSVDEDADLLKAANWTSTNRIGVSSKWLDGQVGAILEGNVVVTPDGNIIDMLRVHHPGYNEYAAMMMVSKDGKKLSFDPSSGFQHMPGGSKKFTIRYDKRTQFYWTLVNTVPDTPPLPELRPDQVRNKLVLARSMDLKKWELRRVVLEHPDVKNVGFQYVDWLFDNSDIIAAVRTAYPEADGTQAHRAHDANWLTFHRIERFST